MWDEIPRNNWLLNLCVMKSNSCVSEERNLYLYLPEGQFFFNKKGNISVRKNMFSFNKNERHR